MQYRDLLSRIGQRIRETREWKGLSQTQLSEASDITDSFLSQIERGRKAPSMDKYCRISAALHVDPSLLMAPGDDGRAKALRELMVTLSDCPLDLIYTATEISKQLVSYDKTIRKGPED